ncbi:MAG: YkgJ family cysteine cluster protein [Proteobacteria bacterium]|nr:YkgJ family cysteine cluster protein [Pseudomonadota bacterium]
MTESSNRSERKENMATDVEIGKSLRKIYDLSYVNLGTTNDMSILLDSIVEILIAKGIVSYHELEKTKKRAYKARRAEIEEQPKIYLSNAPDNHNEGERVAVDCESRYAQCKGSCCKLWFSLSRQDLDEGVVKWKYSQPYAIAQNEEGYCVHQDEKDHKCTVYEHRPYICRTYSCRDDKRIWLDFDKRIINPEIV